MNIQQIEDSLSLINKAENILILSHRNPDGDAIGSSLALSMFLNTLNKKNRVVLPNAIPENMKWMSDWEQILIYESEKDKKNVLDAIKNANLIFTLDFNALHRLGILENELKNIETPFIMIDHHETPDSYAKVTFSNTNYGSTCEMIYDFITFLGYSKNINKDIATCIYTGITTDSGSFKFPKTTSKTHQLVAHLIELGIDNSLIHRNIFDNNSFNSLQLMGCYLTNLKLLEHKKTSYSYLSASELQKYNCKKGDTEGFVNLGLSIKDIEFTAYFAENQDDNLIKISFRSKGNFDVNQFSKKYFEGGGHKNAAGGKSLLSLEETLKRFEEIVDLL
ncbi:MAG: DHH family phosphoesterase [Flavobacterium sp.]|jgi:phosphoesterase RecJ-like protein